MKQKYIFVLILLASIPLLDFLHPGLPITHDGQDHVARIANFYQNLSEGVVIPRWAASLNWGYGHPILMFLYPLPSYIASFFHFLGFSLVDSTKIVFGLAYIASGLSMYLWLKSVFGKEAGFLGGFLYMFAPYRFVDLYVRGAIGEHVAFIFPPLIFYFLLKLALSKKYSYWYIIGVSFSLGALILSHNAISLMFLPIIFLYSLYLLWQHKDKKLLAISHTLSAIFGFGISAFFWIPAFFEGRYTLRDIVVVGEYASRFTDFKNFFWSEWNYGGTGQFSVQIGFIQWFLVLLSILIMPLIYKSKKTFWFVAGTLIVFIVSLFLMTPSAKPIWETVTTLQKFQFPWRFLSITVFISAIIGGFVISSLPQHRRFLIVILISIATLFFNKDYWHAKDFLLKPEGFYTGIYYSTTDTGESSPIWSVRFMEKEAPAHIEVIAGKAEIRDQKRISTYHTYDIKVIEQARIRENTLFFPGWEVFVDGNNTPIEFQDPGSRGLITFFVDPGAHRVEVKFRETRLRFIANVISAVTLGMVLIYGMIHAKSLWRRSL